MRGSQSQGEQDDDDDDDAADAAAQALHQESVPRRISLPSFLSVCLLSFSFSPPPLVSLSLIPKYLAEECNKSCK